MAAMDMDDDEDIWANTTSPSASPPQLACGFISTQLSLNSHLHLLSSSAASPPDLSAGDGIYAAADGGLRRNVGGGFCNAAPASFFSYGLDSVPAPLDAGAARSALEREMGLGPDAAWAGPVGGTDRRKKRMIKNRESAARSRARKQAYVRELEREVKHLQHENASLRAKYEQVTTQENTSLRAKFEQQLRVPVELPVPVPPKKKLQRLASAPF